MVNLAGALGSVALVLSLGYWGWELAVRDVRGVPVVRALEGPMRTAPEEVGGRVIDHQGLFGIDLGKVDTFGTLFGHVDEARLKLFDQLGPQVAQHEEGVHIQITDCQ